MTAKPDQVSNELIAQKLDTFIEEERQWRTELKNSLNNHEQRLQAQEQYLALSSERHTYTLSMINDLREAMKSKASAAEVESLKGQVRTWDVINSLGAAALAVFTIFLKR